MNGTTLSDNSEPAVTDRIALDYLPDDAGVSSFTFCRAAMPQVSTSRDPSNTIWDASVPRKVALGFTCALVFIRFSMLHQLFAYIIGVNTYSLYVFGIPAILGVFATGGLRRSFEYRPTAWWMGYAGWIAVAVPFSIWKGGSFAVCWSFVRAELIMLFVIAGLVLTWHECRRIMLIIAAAAIVSVFSSQIFGRVDAGNRLSLEFGTVANANDFAAHLLLVLPFLIWVVLCSRNFIVRGFALVTFAYGAYAVLASGSRGAAIALVADVSFFALHASRRQRFALCMIGPVLITVAVIALPDTVVHRILSFSDTKDPASQEALESSAARQELLKGSILCALQHPVFGIGPGQFTTFQGSKEELRGTGLYWHNAHNSFTQAASECGIPGLIFYLGGVFSTMALLRKAHSRTRENPELIDVRNAVLCMRLAMVGFCTAIFFLNFAYMFYLPAMAGLSIAISRALDLKARTSNSQR